MKRAGRFLITTEQMEKDPGVVRAIMGNCLITSCQFYYDAQAFQYTAIADGFAEIDDLAVPPFYDINVGEGNAIQFYPQD